MVTHRAEIRLAWDKMHKALGVNARESKVTLRPSAHYTVPIPVENRFKTNIMQYKAFQNNKYPPTTFAPNLHNEIEAVKARVLKQTPMVDPAQMTDFHMWVIMNMDRLFPGFRKQRPLSLQAYLELSNASPSVKEQIRQGGEKNAQNGISQYQTILPHIAHKMTIRKSFVKTENNLYDSPGHSLDKAPRLIQGAQPEFVALVGPMFAAIQKEIKRIWNKNHFVWFTSGASSLALADYITESTNHLIFENDVSAFDTSIGPELCLLELFLAKWMGATPAVLSLMRANIQTHGYTSQGIKYSVRGTRKSGDPYTSVFNSVLNGLMHVYVLNAAGMRIENMHSELRMLVQGDDNLLRHDSRYRPDWSILLRLGFKAENNYRSSLYEAEFCSSRLYAVEGDRWNFGPKIGRLVNKLGSFVLPPKHVHPLAILRGVALGLVTFDYVPLVPEIVRMLLVNTEGHEAYYERPQDWKMKYLPSKPDPVRNGYLMDTVYGLDTYMISKIKSELASKKIGDPIDSTVFELLYDKDTAARQHIFVQVA